MNQNKIVPSVWFHTKSGKINEIVEYYQNIFATNFKAGPIIQLNQTPSGYAEMAEVNLFEQKFMFMSTEKIHQPLNDSVSFMVNCEDQTEINKYWDYFTAQGSESQCGWCIDKFGLRWQVLPKNLSELMARPNAFKVMMSQKKIIIAEY